MTFSIRQYEPRDFEAVYYVCLKTGDGGEDATTLYDDPNILGHMYVGPYVTLEPSLAFVLEDTSGVCGYVLGALTSLSFYERMRTQWLPRIQAQVPNPAGDPAMWTHTEHLYHQVHHPKETLPEPLHAYPSHLHIDLLPRAQRQGNGSKMMAVLLDELKAQGSQAVHLGMDPDNERALRFYRKLGFARIEGVSNVNGLYLGKQL
ncbi:MAG: GNAT family N-acetyltransferase [Deinococcota bacterium]